MGMRDKSKCHKIYQRKQNTGTAGFGFCPSFTGVIESTFGKCCVFTGTVV